VEKIQRKIAYFTLFESHMSNGIVAWDGSSISNTEKNLTFTKKKLLIV